MFTIVVDVFITEFYIFQQVTMQPNPAISLKIKIEKTIKRMEIFDSLRNPPKKLTNTHVKLINFYPGIYDLTTNPECQNSFLSHPTLVPVLV